MTVLKKLAGKLPHWCQQEMKRVHFALHMKRGVFDAVEPEFNRLETWVRRGDFVLDIGANVGHYASRLSTVVGSTGRIIAFEPVPDTFELLAANIARLPLKNVTLLNVAASNKTSIARMTIPTFDTGLTNYYMAAVTDNGEDLSVLCLSIDSLDITESVTLAKMDVEGHELSVLMGMQKLLERDHPVLIVGNDSAEVASYLEGLGYASEHYEGSPNRVYSSSRSLRDKITTV